MIDLYAAGTSNGMRARIALEECGLAYRLHPVDLQKGEQKAPDFLAMNPNGQKRRASSCHAKRPSTRPSCRR